MRRLGLEFHCRAMNTVTLACGPPWLAEPAALVMPEALARLFIAEPDIEVRHECGPCGLRLPADRFERCPNCGGNVGWGLYDQFHQEEERARHWANNAYWRWVASQPGGWKPAWRRLLRCIPSVPAARQDSLYADATAGDSYLVNYRGSR
jgi:hypothetical protein